MNFNYFVIFLKYNLYPYQNYVSKRKMPAASGHLSVATDILISLSDHNSSLIIHSYNH